ncbi:MAG: hypothetical protein PHO89_07730 [Methylacidiphilaceae bacterium]|nr:hypothetical protein [Candidatus Methylacidiphilaceae bacterium]
MEAGIEVAPEVQEECEQVAQQARQLGAEETFKRVARLDRELGTPLPPPEKIQDLDEF